MTVLVDATERGDESAAAELFSALYGELHRMARRELRRSGGSMLGATTVLHEAYLRMADREGIVFPDQPRFFAYASRVMRRLIVDHARRRHAHKRGGLFALTPLDTTVAGRVEHPRELQRISDALDQLADVEPELAEVIDLKFFCGFSFSEIGAMRGASERTIQRHWEKARLFLHHALSESDVTAGP